jgi:M6 family metalloprotease-like protein
MGQGDVEALGRELGGAKPPAGYYDMLARHPTAFRFSAENGWIRRGRSVATRRGAARAALTREPQIGQRANWDANGVLVGDLNIPVFLVMYANTDSTTTVSNLAPSVMQQRLYGTDPAPPYSIHTYYREISGNRLLVNGTVLDWSRVSQDDAYYEGGSGCNGLCGGSKVAELIAEAVQLHDPAVDFGQFDNDGIDGLPNSGDDDGFVDAIVVFHPEVDGACRAINGAAADNIWAHKAQYGFWTGTDLTTADPSASGGNVRVRDYIIQGGQGGDNGCADDQPQAMGVVAHETGHLFGLPDLYNTNSFRSSEGIGHWGIMGSGNWRTPPSPAHMAAWSRAELGWVTEMLIDRDTSLVIDPVAQSDTAFVLPIAGTDEYFLLENRQAIGSDVQMHGPGLLIWHVDSALIATRRFSNTVNAADPEALVLEQADGRGDLQLGAEAGASRRGDDSDPFPGSANNTAFAHNTNPSSARNDGTQTFIIVDSVTQVVPGGAMSLRVRFGKPTLIAATDTLASFRLDSVAWNRFIDVLDSGTDHELGMDSAQVTADGRARYTWVAWSNGQPRTHTFTSSPNGDTIVATVDAEFLLRVVVQGTGGTVASAPPVDLSNGTFVAQDEVVTLVAEASEPGRVFDGWSGDSTTVADTLILTMDRPYDLTASFADELVVTAPQIPAAVIMGSQLSFTFTASGGNGAVGWQLVGGSLPSGVSFFSTGIVVGRPAELGEFNFQVQAVSGSQTVTVPGQMTVVAPALVADDVVGHLVGAGAPLTADELVFLDLLGNGNGRFDVGDFLAWVTQPGVAVSPELVMKAMRESGAAAVGGGNR